MQGLKFREVAIDVLEPSLHGQKLRLVVADAHEVDDPTFDVVLACSRPDSLFPPRRFEPDRDPLIGPSF